jgi:hypothetical protein
LPRVGPLTTLAAGGGEAAAKRQRALRTAGYERVEWQ